MKDSPALKIPAADVMTEPLVTIAESAPVHEALKLLLEKRISGLPVVDGRGRPVGVVTLYDLARYAEWHLAAEDFAEEERDRELARELDRRRSLERRDARGLGMHVDPMSRATVRQVMTPRIVFVKSTATLEDVIRTLQKLHVRRVFVESSRGKLVGVISTADVMRTLYGRALADSGGGRPTKARVPR